MTSTVHESVLLKEVLDLLDVRAGNVVLDATLGGGGHSEAILRSLPGAVKVIALDQDAGAIERVRERFRMQGFDFQAVEADFRDLDRALEEAGIAKVDRILFDLGLSSDQLEVSGRGFAFSKDEPLLMTFTAEPGADDLTASDVVNGFEEESLAAILKGYGDEPDAKRIAKAIVAARPIETSAKLAEIVKNAVPAYRRFGKTHPATKAFQAIRIAVNDEYGAIADGIAKGWRKLEKGGRMAVISFHSGEDRIVKRLFREIAETGHGQLLVKKPIAPSEEEIRRNPRSRSAKLRVVEKNS